MSTRAKFEVIIGIVVIVLWIYPALVGLWAPWPLRPGVRNLASRNPRVLRAQAIIALAFGCSLVVLGLATGGRGG